MLAKLTSAIRYGLGITLGTAMVLVCYYFNRFRVLYGDVRSEELSIDGLRPGLSVEEFQATRGPHKPINRPEDHWIDFDIYALPEDLRVYCREGYISAIRGDILDVRNFTCLKAGWSSKLLIPLRADVRVWELHRNHIEHWYPALGLTVEVDASSQIKEFVLTFPEAVEPRYEST